ncbi:MAG: flagellin [Hyphomicrobium sp.]
MSSLNTNVAALTALQTLNKSSKELLVTQNRISTGLRVASAADNAAYFSIATTLRSDNAAISTVADALGLGSATVEVAEAGIKNAIETVSQIKAKLVAARAPGLDRAKIQTEISALQSSLRSTADSAVFSGQNFLAGDSTGPTTKTIVSSFSRDSTGAISIGTISIDVGPTGTLLFDTGGAGAGILDSDRTVTSGATYSVATLDISAITDDSADLVDLEDLVKGVDAALSAITDAATILGAAKSRISLQSDFVSKLRDTIDTGIGQLVDADLNEESTRLQALQVRQQLGVQALGIANQSAQQILSLFQ